MSSLVSSIDAGEEWSGVYERLSESKMTPGPLNALFAPYVKDMAKLDAFLSEVRLSYNDNPYHSFDHACHVTCSAQCLLNHLDSAVAANFDDLDHLALLFSAAIHDVDHLGVFNGKLVADGHPYALQFNDQSVAEMRSLQLGFQFLARPECDFLSAQLSREEMTRFRKTVIDLVLCTDIGGKDRSQLTMLKIKEAFSSDTGEIAAATATPDGRLASLMLLLKSADVCANMQRGETGFSWARKFFMEGWTPVSKQTKAFDAVYWAKDQGGYLRGYCLKVASMLRASGVVHPSLGAAALANIAAMADKWDVEGVAITARWAEAAVLERP